MVEVTGLGLPIYVCECILNFMVGTERIRSSAGVRREQVLAAALPVFAVSGFEGTPVTAVAEAAGISQGYVLRLFGTKLGLSVAVVDRCYQRIRAVLEDAADAAHAHAGGVAEPAAVLDAMAHAYGDLIADRTLLMVQVHAQSASATPEIRQAVQSGLRSLVDRARERSRASESQLQRFFAFGQLCHLIVTAELGEIDAPWARVLTHGMHHPAPADPGTG
jgi:AcrR family transcriptional regulator